MTSPAPDDVSRADTILKWWFGDAHDEMSLAPDSPYLARWFRGSAAQDAEIAERFGADHEHAAAWKLSDWAESPRGRQALVIIYDQFSRTLHRGSPRMFEWDRRAQSLARRSLADGLVHRLPYVQQLFVMVPLGRAEQVEDQEMYLAWIQHVAEEARIRRLPSVGFWSLGAERARSYLETIVRFGRFPQRNSLLGREPTDSEKQFSDTELV